MKQDKPKTQESNAEEKVLFSTQAVNEAEKVVPISENTAQAANITSHPRVEIRGFRRKMSPLAIALIAILSVSAIALTGSMLYKSAAQNADINDEALIIENKNADPVETPFREAAESLTALEEKPSETFRPPAPPPAKVTYAAKKPDATYSKPSKSNEVIIRDDDFERERIIIDKDFEKRIKKALKRHEHLQKGKPDGKRKKKKNKKGGKGDDDDDDDDID